MTINSTPKLPPQKYAISHCRCKGSRIDASIVEQTPQEQDIQTGNVNRQIEDNIIFASFQKFRKLASPLSVIIANTSRHIQHQFNQLARPIYCRFGSGQIYYTCIDSAEGYSFNTLGLILGGAK
jgi:hypothetical protein